MSTPTSGALNCCYALVGLFHTAVFVANQFCQTNPHPMLALVTYTLQEHTSMIPTPRLSLPVNRISSAALYEAPHNSHLP